jgi:hypothetical protein
MSGELRSRTSPSTTTVYSPWRRALTIVAPTTMVDLGPPAEARLNMSGQPAAYLKPFAAIAEFERGSLVSGPGKAGSAAMAADVKFGRKPKLSAFQQS